MRSAWLFAGCCLLATSAQAQRNVNPQQPFDTYVLALSWQPSYCRQEGRDRREETCRTENNGFTVHGLWPQQSKPEKGKNGRLQYCDFAREPQRPLIAELPSIVASRGQPVPDEDEAKAIQGAKDLMPTRGQARYQWRKHGSCTGLSQQQYYDTIRKANSAVVIPDTFRDSQQAQRMTPQEVEAAFVKANAKKGWKKGMVTTSCNRGLLRDVKICLKKDKLTPVACPPAVLEDACDSSAVNLPAMR